MPQLAANRDKQAESPAQNAGGLLALAQQGRHFEVLAAGYQQFARAKNVQVEEQHRDALAALTVLMIRSLVALGLGGPARELLQHAKQLKLQLDFDALRATLVPIPMGRVPWSEMAARYESNTSALLNAQPELASALDEIQSIGQASQLFQTHDGTMLLAGPRTETLRQWNPGFIDPSAFRNVSIATVNGGQSMLVIGLGADAMFDRIVDETATPEHDAGVLLLVVEPDSARAYAALHTLDLAPLLACGRVRLFLGSAAHDQLASFLASRPDVDLPVAAVTMQWANEFGELLSSIVAAERSRREVEFAATTATLTERSASRRLADHADRLAPGATILGFTSRFTTMLQYSMRDIGAALAEHGYNFVLERETDNQRTHSSLTIARAIAEHDPALVIMINHFRRERAGAMTGVPVLTWIQDPTPLVLSRETGSSFTNLDFACGYYITECTEQFGYPKAQFFSACLPVSAHLFHDAPLEGHDAKAFSCDVMYVGHRHSDAETHVATWRDSTPAGLHPLLDQLKTHIETMIKRHEPLHDPQHIVRDLAARGRLTLSEGDVDRLANYFVARLHDILYRAQTLHWVARWAQHNGRSFKLYGKGWSDDATLAPHAVGPIEHGEALRKAYRGAKIVLQTLPAGFMHQRTFEGLASGSLVLARHAVTSSADLHFPGVDRVVFREETQLLAMLDRYLSDEAHRNSVQREMRDVVMRRFTYSALMPEIINWIRQSLHSLNGAST